MDTPPQPQPTPHRHRRHTRITRKQPLRTPQVVNDTLRRGLYPASAKAQTPYRVKPNHSGLRHGVDILRLNQLSDELHSNDSDFNRFPGLRWHNPLQT